jgi:long-chain fatty acid transport protein
MSREPWFAAVTLSLLAAQARADGFRVVQGGRSLGNCGAGSAAAAEDASTVFHNPAGMARIRDGFVQQVDAIDVNLDFDDRGTRGATGLRPGGGDGRHAGGVAPVAALFGVTHLSDEVAIGVGLTSPFGLTTDYGETWVGRYHSTQSSLRTLDLSPCVAWRASGSFAVGAGIDLQWASAELSNAVDFGSVAEDEFGEDLAHSLGLRAGKDDGRATLRGDSFGVGGTAGLLWQPDACTRVGLTYRSAVHHELDGEAHFVLPRDAQRLRLGGYFLDTGAAAEISMPETVSLGFVRSVQRDVDVLAGVDWTRWSRFDTLDVDFDNPKQEDSSQPQRWHDTFRPAAGLTWRADERWTLRTGAAWDPSTVSDSDRRPRAPDAPRLSVSAGVGYRISEFASIDLVWLHAWGRDVPVDLDEEHAGRLRGEYSTSLDYVSLQLTIEF